ncbi:Uncharacterised protein [Vibrio cholerae]|nr:Uncharacterised protein [Vibrio cholerae]
MLFVQGAIRRFSSILTNNLAEGGCPSVICDKR